MAEITKEQMRERLGNINQIRDLLFGDKIEEYEQHFENYDRHLGKLESDLSKFQSQISARLAQLQDSLSIEIRSGLDALEKKIAYLSLNTQQDTKKLKQELNFTEQKLTHNFQSLRDNFTVKTTLINNQLSQTKDKIEADIQHLRLQVFEEIDKSFSQLTENKVSRADLGELLFELCLKIKGTDLPADLETASEPEVTSELFNLENNHNGHLINLQSDELDLDRAKE